MYRSRARLNRIGIIRKRGVNMADVITENRLRLFAHGYLPVPTIGKRCVLKGWPSYEITESAIEMWGYRYPHWHGTAIRLDSGLCIIDIDINHALAEDVADAMAGIAGEVPVYRVQRYSGGHSIAWFCRTADNFGRITTCRWVKSIDKLDEGSHFVEVFGGAGAPHLMSVLGAHSFDEVGKVSRSYAYSEESILDVPKNSLPLVSRELVDRMLCAAEEVFTHAGWVKVANTKRGETLTTREYILTPDMVFNLFDRGEVDFPTLAKEVSDNPSFEARCSASFTGEAATFNCSRCLIHATRGGFIQIWDTATGILYYPESVAPVPGDELMAELAKGFDVLKVRGIQKSLSDLPFDGVVALLLNEYGYCPTELSPVIPLWPQKGGVGAMTMKNFREVLSPYSIVEHGVRGGVIELNPVDDWVKSDRKCVIQGQQMRPEKQRPVFYENDVLWHNTYRPFSRAKVEGGSVKIGLEFIRQLVPDKAEREWFFCWLAYKLRHPHIPGPALVMVARDFGTGRGTFIKLLGAIFGAHYVSTIPFDVLSGRSSQASFMDWMLNTLFCVVNESSASMDTSPYKVKLCVYERLKELVDPAPVHRVFTRKTKTSVETTSSASFILLTNHIDALPLPEDDRRFVVLTNGQPRDTAFWDKVDKWMHDTRNISAFIQYLEDVVLDNYSPFALPLMTKAKMAMANSNLTSMDTLIIDALAESDAVCVADGVCLRVKNKALDCGITLPTGWQALVKRGLRQRWFSVHYADQNAIRRVSLNKQRHTIYCRTCEMADELGRVPEIPEELIKQLADTLLPVSSDSWASLANVTPIKQKDTRRGKKDSFNP